MSLCLKLSINLNNDYVALPYVLLLCEKRLSYFVFNFSVVLRDTPSRLECTSIYVFTGCRENRK